MPITFDLSKLTSRQVRANIGDRIIKPLESLAPTTTNGNSGGIVGFFLNAGANLVGFILGAIGNFFKFSWNLFWSWCVAVKNFIWNFNWNATDAQLDSSIKSKWASLKAQLGGALGNAFGYLACGFLPGAIIFAFNAPLGAYVLANVGEEFLDEFLENMGAMLRQTLILGTQIALTEAFKSARKLIKQNSTYLSKLFTKSPDAKKKIQDAIAAWGAQGSKPWSFALAHDEKIESLDINDQEFWEEFDEEADEACIEAGYVVANSVDRFLAGDMLAKQQTPLLGNIKYVEITPNRNVPEEKLVLGGNEDLLKPIIIQTLATHQQLGDRDLGTIYGTDDEQPVRSIKPEIVLKFYQERKDRIIGQDANGKDVSDPNPLSMRISFRLMNKDESNFITDVYANDLANKIYTKFGSPPFKIHKGSHLYTYTDYAKGYQMILWVESQSEARRIVEQILDIQGHSVDDEKLRIGSKPIGVKTKQKKTVLGNVELVSASGTRTGIVTFKSAHLNIGNGTRPVSLVDLTGKKRNTVFKK